ncbi:MAG: homoserine kinase [Armatimonadetes bacterium]|nr:homoserine kinase [Armatimonadota bacterium]
MRVVVPATAANLGPGFDSLGLALALFNTVQVAAVGPDSCPDAVHTVEGEGAPTLPRGPDNLVRRSMAAVAARAGVELPAVAVRQVNAIPLARGLGSSSAAIVGGCVAANEVLGRPLSQDDLLAIAVEIEGHPDNVAPALLGGLTVCYAAGEGARCLRLEPLDPPRAVVAVPDYEVETEKARQALPPSVPRRDAVLNVGRAAALVGAFATGRYDLLRAAMDDRLHQPYRAHLVPGMDEAIAAALDAGALGACLSGSGPTVLAFAAAQEDAIAEAMKQALAALGVTAATRVLDVCLQGATVTYL